MAKISLSLTVDEGESLRWLVNISIKKGPGDGINEIRTSLGKPAVDWGGIMDKLSKLNRQALAREDKRRARRRKLAAGAAKARP